MNENTKFSPFIILGSGIFSVKLPSISDTDPILLCLSKYAFTKQRLLPCLSEICPLIIIV